MYLITETFLRYKTNILFLTFNQVKESASSKNAASLFNKAVSEKGNENLVQNKLIRKIK